MNVCEHTRVLGPTTGYQHRIVGRPLRRWYSPRERQRPATSVLGQLRDLAPRRALQPIEAFMIAELQAERLLELSGLQGPPTPQSLVTDLPRYLVRVVDDLPVSGSAQWVEGRWLLLLNGSESYERRRYSLAHEFKHTLDHRWREAMYRQEYQQARNLEEQVADYFGACLLMPKAWIKRAWSAGTNDLADMASLFAVSEPAMARRLDALGLRERHDDFGDVRAPTDLIGAGR